MMVFVETKECPQQTLQAKLPSAEGDQGVNDRGSCRLALDRAESVSESLRNTKKAKVSNLQVLWSVLASWCCLQEWPEGAGRSHPPDWWCSEAKKTICVWKTKARPCWTIAHPHHCLLTDIKDLLTNQKWILFSTHSLETQKPQQLT